MKRSVWIMNHYSGDMFRNKDGRHYNFAKYLKIAGYDPVVFCCNAMHGKPELYFDTYKLWEEHEAEEIGVPFVFVKGRTYMNNGKQRILNMIDFYCNVQKTVKQYARIHGKPDVIYASSVHPLTLAAGIKLAKYFKVPCICEIRDLWPETLVAYGIAGPHNPAVLVLRRLEKWTYKKAGVIVFTMERAYDYIIERGWEKDILRSKVFYINNGVDLESFDYNKEHYKVVDSDLENPDIFKVVYTGSIRKVNNLGLLLSVAKQITDPKIRFLVWGEGDELEKLKQRAIDENIGNVFFKGRVDKKYIPYITSRSDLNIAHNTPSSLFRFGISFNKLFDYFAAGKPILSDFPCPYNPAVYYGAGISVDNPDPYSIAQAVEKFDVMNLEEYMKFCECAKEASKEFDFKNLTHKLISVIENAG